MGKAQDLIGAEFDGYRIVRLLGQGGMGAVYEGLDLSLNRRVAIKVLAESVNRDPDAVKRFQREARAVALVSHPNIAQIYRVGILGGLHYYAMEFVEGKSLEQMITEQNRVHGPRCFNLMVQAVKALKAAADRGIIHRDIKPANLMVTTNGMIKIVDFGIAKVMDDSETFRTMTGTIMGTPSYMSPEQCKGQAVDFKSDMYSLGCTFFHALTGRPPFSGDTAYAIMSKQISAPAPVIPAIVAHVPERFCNIIYSMMEKNPDNRYQSYEHLLSVLEAAREGRASVFTARVLEPEPTPEELAAASRRRIRAYIIAGVIMLLLVLFVTHQMSHRQPPVSKHTKTGQDDSPGRDLRGVGKSLSEIDKADREARKEARDAY
jgi:serine/threonine-protein kinase